MAINGVNSAEAFDKWQNSSENYNNAINKKEVEDFKFFEYEDALEKGNIEKAYGQAVEQFSQDFIDIYDKDGNGQMDFDEYMAWTEASYKEMFGEDLDTSIPGMTDMMKESFAQLSKLNPDDKEGKYIDAKEFGAYIALVDGQDEGKIDGKLDYLTYQTLPEAKGFEKALENYYNAIYYD